MTHSLPMPVLVPHAQRIHLVPYRYQSPVPCLLFCPPLPVSRSPSCPLLPLPPLLALFPPFPSQTYIETMPQCLVEYCTSAPSTAYALEYGFSWCRRAGVDVTSSLALPQSYLDGPASAYFK
jgi:hypothetical protein